MKTVEIIEDFTGYPSLKGRPVTYRRGETPEVPEAFAALIIEKGHAKSIGATAEKAERAVAKKETERGS